MARALRKHRVEATTSTLSLSVMHVARQNVARSPRQSVRQRTHPAVRGQPLSTRERISSSM